MGQKVNPKGLRLGISYDWSSRWFFSQKRKYKQALLADILIRDSLMKKLSFASITQVDIERAINKIVVIIHSVKPGMIIGRGGKGLEDIKKLILKSIKKVMPDAKEAKIDLKIEPVKKPYLNAHYVAQTISEKLVKGFPHRSVIHRTQSRVMEAGAKGVKVQVGGRIGGSEIARREKYRLGKVPTSTIREEIDFANYPALTRNGYVGVKVWICK